MYTEPSKLSPVSHIYQLLKIEASAIERTSDKLD